MLITRKSRLSGIERTIELPITEDQLQKWQQGLVIQAAMPNLNSAEREFVMTGITDDEWTEMFGIMA